MVERPELGKEVTSVGVVPMVAIDTVGIDDEVGMENAIPEPDALEDKGIIAMEGIEDIEVVGKTTIAVGMESVPALVSEKADAEYAAGSPADPGEVDDCACAQTKNGSVRKRLPKYIF